VPQLVEWKERVFAGSLKSITSAIYIAKKRLDKQGREIQFTICQSNDSEFHIRLNLLWLRIPWGYWIPHQFLKIYYG